MTQNKEKDSQGFEVDPWKAKWQAVKKELAELIEACEADEARKKELPSEEG